MDSVREESRRYILDRWLKHEELDFLGFRLLSVRLNSTGGRELVVGVRPPLSADVMVTPIRRGWRRVQIMTASDKQFLRSIGIECPQKHGG